MTIPLTFSIANGLAFGFTAYTLHEGGARQVPPGELVRLRADGAVYRALRVPVAAGMKRPLPPYRAENRKIVVALYVMPGFSSVEGNAGLLGESG